MAKVLHRICVATLRCIKFAFSANIEQYFLYNGITYLVLGVISWLAAGQIRAFLCNIPAQVRYGGMGCPNCPDILLMCDKEPCWIQATNLTIQKNAATPDMGYFEERIAAATDNTCNSLIVSSNGPSSMLTGIIAARANNGNTRPSTECVRFHCQILLNAVLDSENTDLPGLSDDVCTNHWDLKRNNFNNCTCSLELQTLELAEANSFQNLCGPMAEELGGNKMYSQILRKSKSACYANNILGFYSALFASDPAAASRTFAERNCTYLTQKAYTVFEWFTLGNHETQLYLSGMTPFRFNVPSTCRLEYCNIFNWTLYSEDCNWQTNQQLLAMTQADIDTIMTNCPGFGYTTASICAIVGTAPQACGGTVATTVPAATTTTAAGGASARRLDIARPAAGAPQPCADNEYGQTTCQPGSRELMRGLHVGLQGGHDLEAPALYHPSSSPMPRLPEPLAFPLDITSSSRKLQAGNAPSPSVNNDDLEDWTTSQWSKCTCLQQCTEGMQYRSVSCPAGVVCKEPKPPTTVSCICGHCADCQVEDIIRSLAATYWFQSIACLTLAMSFFTVSSMTEDDLSDMRCWTKLLGCYCKVLPLLVRIGVYCTLILILYLVLVVIPGTGFMNDCASSESLVMLTICVSATFVLQLIAGIAVKRRRVMPAWLHNSVREGWATYVMLPIRLIGP